MVRDREERVEAVASFRMACETTADEAFHVRHVEFRGLAKHLGEVRVSGPRGLYSDLKLRDKSLGQDVGVSGVLQCRWEGSHGCPGSVSR